RLRHLGERAEVLVIPRPLAGQQDVQGVMEVVRPRRSETAASPARRTQEEEGVQIALRKRVERPAQTTGQLAHRGSQLLQERPLGGIGDGVDRVETETVEV